MCSSEDMQSVKSLSDPEIELEMPFETGSFADALFEPLQTYEIVDSGADMSRSPQTNDNGSPEDVCQNPANVSEWVDQQSLPMPPPKVAITTPIPNSKIETRQSTSGSLAGEMLQRDVYGISTLLKLGEATTMKHMELRINPGALTGKPAVFAIPFCQVFTFSSTMICRPRHQNYVDEHPEKLCCAI